MKKTNVPIVTLAIFMTTFMTAIEGTIVSTAMPTIVSDLDGLEIMNWVVSIFLLMTAQLLYMENWRIALGESQFFYLELHYLSLDRHYVG